MTKKELFTKAHEMTKKIKAEFPEIDYRAQFSICLKALTEKNEDKNIEDKKEQEIMNKILAKKTIELNGFTRDVAIKIEGNKMFGIINKTRFIWDFINKELPIVETKDGADKLKAAKYARLYIIKRLEADNIQLPIKTKKRTVDYITLEKSNGVWINCFKNGYMRGTVDGVPFTWDPSKYTKAAVVTESGFKGSISQTIDTDRIKARLREAGFTSLKNLIATIESKTAAPVAEQPSDKFVIIERTPKITVKYHENRFLSGCVGSQEFSWKNNSVTTLPNEIVKIVKSFDNMDGLVDFDSDIFTCPTLSLMNELATMFKNYDSLNDIMQYIHEGDRTAESILETLNNRMDYIEECMDGDNLSNEHIVLKEAIEKVSSMITIEGQIVMEIA